MKKYTDEDLVSVCENNILETKEAVLYIMRTTDNKYLRACTACNAGMIHHESFKIDHDFSINENLAMFIEELLENYGEVE